MLDATRWGVATCWIGPGADHDSIRSALGDRFDPQRDHLVCVCAVGYKSFYLPTLIKVIQLFQHRRLPISSLFFADSGLEQPLDIAAAPFDASGRTYEACQWSPSSFDAQPTRCVGRIDDAGHGRAARFDFYASTSSRYYAPVALGIWCAHWETGCEEAGRLGHFAVLPSLQRGRTAVPHYDVSWLQDSQVLSERLLTGSPRGSGRSDTRTCLRSSMGSGCATGRLTEFSRQRAARGGQQLPGGDHASHRQH